MWPYTHSTCHIAENKKKKNHVRRPIWDLYVTDRRNMNARANKSYANILRNRFLMCATTQPSVYLFESNVQHIIFAIHNKRFIGRQFHAICNAYVILYSTYTVHWNIVNPFVARPVCIHLKNKIGYGRASHQLARLWMKCARVQHMCAGYTNCAKL